MAQTVKIKRSNTAATTPSLVYGELGFNSADSKLYVGSFANTAIQLGSVTTLSIVTANGVSGSVATATTTPAITVTLGAITPSSVTVSGVITCSAGSSALPSITTSSDTDTGLFFPAANSVSTSVGGVEKLRIDSNGIGIGVREGGGVSPSTYYLSTQANAGLTILHAAKAGTASAYHTKRHLMAYTFNTGGGAGGNGIVRIKIPVITAGGSLRLTIKSTPLATAINSEAWEITLCDYYIAGYTFTKDSFSVTGSPNFSRVRLMTDSIDRYLVLGYFVAGAGTVTTASSTTVTGSGTSFLSLFRVGDSILIAGTWSQIAAIASDTSLTVFGTLGVNTGVTYSRGDNFVGPQITIDADVGNVGSTLQVNTAFAIDFAESESTLSLVSAANDIWLTNTSSQHSFVGVGTQRPTSLFHVKSEKIGQGTVSNSAAGSTVTGVNTLFLDTFKVGDSITIPSVGTAASPQTVVISAIASNTSMTVAAITNANSGVNYSLVGGTLFSVAGNGTITTSSGNTLSGTNTGDQTAASLGLVIGTNVQAYDAGLASIAAATTAADRFLYTTALDVYAVGTITTFGRSLVDDADAATARTTLGLVIGTNVQAYDAGLLSIAAATTAADRFLYTTALDVYAVGTITTFGRSLVDDADAATARTTLGLGTLATQSGTFSGTSSGTNTGDQTLAGLGVNIQAGIPGGRLTLLSGSGFTNTDQIAKATLYYTPYAHNSIALWSVSTSLWVNYTFAEISIALTGYTWNNGLSTGTGFDVFASVFGGAVILSTVEWTSNSGLARSSALAYQDGVPVLSADRTKRYLGTFITTAVGQTTDREFYRYLYNYYNKKQKILRTSIAANHAYATATIRAYNGGVWAAGFDKVSFVNGLEEQVMGWTISATIQSMKITGGTSSLAAVGMTELYNPSTTAYTSGSVSGTLILPEGVGSVYVLETGVGASSNAQKMVSEGLFWC